jgi:hypothetical protein
MVKRRQFVGGLVALGGSYLLGACGGGGGEESNGGTSASGNSAVKATAHTAVSPSANGAAMPPASSIIDSAGAVWTLSGGVLYKNGAVVGNNYNWFRLV